MESLKNKISLLALGGFISIGLINAQNQTPLCGNAPTTLNNYNSTPTYNSNASSSPPSGCNQFLKDFIPQPSDPVLEVKVNFFVIEPTNGPGVWSGSSSANADWMLAQANQILSNLQPPNLGGGIPYPHGKIKLVNNLFMTIQDTYMYNNIDTYLNYPFNNYNPGAINVYLTIDAPGQVHAPHVVLPLPNPHIVFPSVGINNVASIDGGVFLHEFGHTLGLGKQEGLTNYPNQQHPGTFVWYPDRGQESIDPTFGCCTHIVSDDIVYQSWPDFWNGSLGQSCNNLLPASSNNIMSYNWGCRNNISPQQLAKMNYYLRTDFKTVLTAQSYNNDLSRNPALDINIISDQVWTNERYIKGNLTVKSGYKLEIKCTVGMVKNSCIIVERGAQLIINTGGHITNISGQLWEGIKVYGSPNLAQILNNSTGFASNQGVCRIINGGKISQAERGVMNWYEGVNGIDWNSRGGIIIGNGGFFVNNRRDVEMISYLNPNGNDYTNFINCNFSTDINFNGTSAPNSHVSLWNINGVQFKGCKFDFQSNPANISQRIGISSIDAIYTVDKWGNIPTTFNNLAWGIRVYNSNPLKVVSVRNTIFNNQIMEAVNFQNMNSFIFENNTVNLTEYFNTNGLYLNNCKNYQVKNNIFAESTVQSFKQSVGIIAFHNQTGSHQIYNNKFSSLQQGISCIGDNSGTGNYTDGLRMNCNDFTPISNKWDITMLKYQLNNSSTIVPPTVMLTQGNLNANSPFGLVRNKYGAPSACSTCENKWYVEGNSVKNINHGSNSFSSGSMFHPTPQPANSDLSLFDSPQGFVFQLSDCPGNPGFNGGINTNTQKLLGITNYLYVLYENNSQENNLHFDIQATVAEKINYYLNDSLASGRDSVISILLRNEGQMDNADILLVYAYLNKEDYTTALAKTNALGSNRNDWKNLLLKQIEIAKDPNKLYSLRANTDNVAFLNSYANNDSKDGQMAAQAMLTGALNYTFTAPRYTPNEGSSARTSRKVEETTSNINTSIINNSAVQVFPNPTNTGVTIMLENRDESKLLIQIKDLLGKVIYSGTYFNKGDIYLPLTEISNGIYLLSISNSKNEITYQSKLVKQD
jgi:hypothetical protein